MTTIIIICLIAVIVFVTVMLLKGKNQKTDDKSQKADDSDKNTEDPLKGKKYKAKEKLLTENEYSFYLKLIDAFPDYNIQVQQVLYSFIEQEKEYFNQRPTGLYKSVDFLLCDDDLTPIVAIEINDKSHTSLDRQKRDAFVSTLLERCEIPLEVFQASDEISVSELRKRIKKHIQ